MRTSVIRNQGGAGFLGRVHAMPSNRVVALTLPCLDRNAAARAALALARVVRS